MRSDFQTPPLPLGYILIYILPLSFLYKSYHLINHYMWRMIHYQTDSCKSCLTGRSTEIISGYPTPISDLPRGDNFLEIESFG